MRIGIFGGTFDPVHIAHLLLAETCREQAVLNEVWFVPAAVSPWKTQTPPIDAKHRLQMLQLALAGQESFQLCTRELDVGGVSFTVDTLRWIRQQQPTAELFLLMGADALKDFPHWREPETICQMALPLVVRRRNAPEPDFKSLAPLLTAQQMKAVQGNVVDMPVVEISSSELRRRLSQQRSIRYQVPRAVEKYIETHGLYG
jgi:nicotinate-nucleotide adenylyltransferase